MSFKTLIKAKTLTAAMILVLVAGQVGAQNKDTSVNAVPIESTMPPAAVSSPDAVDTAAIAASTPLISTEVDTTASTADYMKAAVDNSPMYRSAFYYFLLFVLGCLFVGIVGKVLRVYELTKEVQGKGRPINWNRVQGVLFAFALLFGLYGVYWSYTTQGPLGIHESASLHGSRIDNMFLVTLIITSIVFIITHILLFGFSFVYNGSEKKKAYFYPHNNALERLWTIVPAIVLTVLVLLGFFTWRSITNVSDADKAKALNIEITGEQFKWSIRYSGDDNKIGLKNYKLISPQNNLGIDFTKIESQDDKLAGEIVIPVNKPVRFQIGSKDVLHSFYMPDFRAQINAVPGMPTFFQFTPTKTTAEMREIRKDPTYDYILLCAKICGKGHYNMQAKVRVVSEAEYKEWLAKQPLFFNDDVKKQMQMADEKKASENNNIALNN